MHDTLCPFDRSGNHLVLVLGLRQQERGCNVHDIGAAFHRIGPSSVGRKVGLDEAEPIDRSHLRDSDPGGIRLGSGTDRTHHLVALPEQFGRAVLTDVSGGARQQYPYRHVAACPCGQAFWLVKCKLHTLTC